MNDAPKDEPERGHRHVEPLAVAMAATLRAERAAREVTVAQLVERSGMSKSTVLRLLSGEREVTTSSLSKLAEAMEAAPEIIMLRAVERMHTEANS